MTKEERKIYHKKWYQANQEKIKAYRKKHRENQKKYEINYRISRQDGLYRVYLLVDYNYVGYTKQAIKDRFKTHKTHYNRDCTNYKILYSTTDKEKAKEIESILHLAGFIGNKTGKHNNHPKGNNHYTKIK